MSLHGEVLEQQVHITRFDRRTETDHGTPRTFFYEPFAVDVDLNVRDIALMLLDIDGKFCRRLCAQDPLLHEKQVAELGCFQHCMLIVRESLEEFRHLSYSKRLFRLVFLTDTFKFN